MSKHHPAPALAVFVVILSLAYASTLCCAVTFRARTRAWTLTVPSVGGVMAAINALIGTIDVSTLYYAGRSFTNRIVVETFTISIRLWVFNARTRSLSGECSANPLWREVVRGDPMVRALRVLSYAVQIEADTGRYGRVVAVLENIGMEYIVMGGPNPYMFNGSLSASKSNITRVNAIQPSDADCSIYGTTLTSGTDGPGTHLAAGDSLVSGNKMYTLAMQTDCNLVLYNRWGTAIWASDTNWAHDGGCVLAMQMDGNLVLFTSSGRVIWATNTYCQPEPDCEVTSALVVQDDGNLVLYHTDTQTAVWAANTEGDERNNTNKHF